MFDRNEYHLYPDMRTPKPTLRDRVEAWIDKNVPVYSRMEYKALLETNADLVITLVAKCMDFDALLKAHYQLQEEATRRIPMPSLVVDTDFSVNPMQQALETRITYRMDPFWMHTSLPGGFRGYVDLDGIREAFKEVFHRKFVPALWEKTQVSLYRTAAKSGVCP